MNVLKNYIQHILLATTLIIVLASCKKTFDAKIPVNTVLGNTSSAQLYIATVNATRNYIYMNSQTINGAALGTGSIFPGAGTGFSIPAGATNFLIQDVLATATQKPLYFAENIPAGKTYTIFMYDTITSPKYKLVDNNFTVPTDTSCRVRFINLVYDPTSNPAVDVYSTSKQANVFTNVKVSEVTDYVPMATNTTDTLSIRLTGSNIDLMNITPPTPAPGNVLTPVRGIYSFSEKRNYTFIFRGSYRTTLTNATQQRTVSLIANY